MSIIAIAAARADGLDIVTDSVPLHQALAALDERTVLSTLFGRRESRELALAQDQMVDQLVHMVMTTTFDLWALTVQDVAGLVSDGHDLRAFKKAVTEAASSVPRDAGPERREALLRQVAEEVVEEWQRYRVTLPRKLLRALRDASSSSASTILKRAGSAFRVSAVSGGATTGATGWAALHMGLEPSAIVLASAAGMAVGAITFGKAMLASASDEPLRYLTRVTAAGATLLVVPRAYRRTRDVKAS
jgi:hypothetical protein